MTPDALFTFALSAALLTGGGLALWMLPWTDAELENTGRAFTTFGRAARTRVVRLAQPVPVPVRS